MSSPRGHSRPCEVRTCSELITDAGVVRAVDGVSFNIDRGETVTIIGESGSGKSTTAMGILRLLPDDLAVISGRGPHRRRGRHRRAARSSTSSAAGRVALIPQDPMTALSPVRTIGRQLTEAVRITVPRRSAKAEAQGAGARRCWSRCTSPTPPKQLDAYPHQLSGGMLQRVLIAIARLDRRRPARRRRADQRARRHGAGRHPRPAARAAGADRHRAPDDHPRPRRGAAHERPHPRHEGRRASSRPARSTDVVDHPAAPIHPEAARRRPRAGPLGRTRAARPPATPSRPALDRTEASHG